MRITGELPNNCTKADEIAVLDELVQHIGDQTYLAQLFSKPMLAWAKIQIQNDFGLDLYDDLNRSEKKVEGLYSELRESETYREFERKDYGNIIEKQKADIETAKELLALKEDTLRTYIKTNNDLALRVDAQAETISKLEQQVKELKAKLYDLMTKEA